jgi:translation elongation factor EF-1beta
MTMRVEIKDKYMHKFEELINSLPKDAIVIKNSLAEEIQSRSNDYHSGKMKTVPFGTGLDRIREKLVSQL